MNRWFVQRVPVRGTLAAATPAVLLASAVRLGYTQTDARMDRGVTLAVITLAAVVYTTIIGVLILTAYLLHKKQSRRKNRPQYPVNL